MKIFIDTPSIWNSGYETHLTQFVKNIDNVIGDDELLIYGHSNLLRLISPYSQKVNFIEDNSIPCLSYEALIWRKRELPKIINYYSPDIHLNLMGWIHHQMPHIRRVSMNRNLQPFINFGLSRTPVFSKDFFRLKLYKSLIIKCYNNSDGLICNSDFASDLIKPYINNDVKVAVIPHGVNEKFFITPREQTIKELYNILYISDFYPYKNHDNVIRAIDLVRKKTRLKIKLNLIGNFNQTSRTKIERIIKVYDQDRQWINIKSKIPNDELYTHLLSNDIYIYASSVESFGHSLIEAMAAGLPIVCSNKRPMIDFLGLDRIDFNELDYEDIAEKVTKVILSPDLRDLLAKNAFKRAQSFSYYKMTLETLSFIRSIS